MTYDLSKRVLGVSLKEKGQCVQGIIVQGLSKSDMTHITRFEGIVRISTRLYLHIHPDVWRSLKYYKCISVEVKQLGKLVPSDVESNNDFSIETSSPCTGDDQSMKCLTFIWDQAINLLSPELWDYALFLKESLYLYTWHTVNCDYKLGVVGNIQNLRVQMIVTCREWVPPFIVWIHLPLFLPGYVQPWPTPGTWNYPDDL